MPDEHLPPHDLQAELAVLGSILLDPSSIYLLAGEISPDDFYREKHKNVFQAAEALAKRGTGIDLITISDELSKADKLDFCGGPSFLTSLLNEVPTASHIVHYSRIVREKARLRRLIHISSETVRQAYSPDAESMAVWSASRASLDDILAVTADSNTMLFDTSLDWYVGLQAQRNEDRQNNVKVHSFPWADLQDMIPVIPRGTMVLVVAKPSVGKTTFFECLAEHWAMDGFTTLFFHAELSHSTMLDRRAARHSGVSVYDLMRGVMNEQLVDAFGRISKWPGKIHYIHCPGWSMNRIATKARQMAASSRVDAVIVDYLQKLKVTSGEHGQNLAQLRGGDAEELKTLGEELGLVTVLGSQRSRQKQGDETLTASDSRDSQEPLEKCNIALALGRKLLTAPIRDNLGHIVANIGDMAPVVQVRIDKHTMGKVGEVKLLLVGHRFNLVNLAQTAQ